MTIEAAAIAAQAALTRQSIAIESLRLANEQSASLIDLVSQSVAQTATLASPTPSANVPVSPSSGVNVDFNV